MKNMLSILFFLAVIQPKSLMLGQSSVTPTTPRLKSPEISDGREVTFRLVAPKASTVTLNGSWVGATNLPMTKDESGVWSTTVGPMKPQMYGYWYLVDGVRAIDPSNSETERDGSRFNSMLMVSGPDSALWDFKDVPHGTVEQIWYPSPTLHMDQRCMSTCRPAMSGRRPRNFPFYTCCTVQAAMRMPGAPWAAPPSSWTT